MMQHNLRKQLIGLLLESSTRLGRVSTLDRVVQLADAHVAASPKRADAYLVRARAYGAVHRFSDALSDIDKAIELGAIARDTDGQRATIWMAQGKLDEAHAVLKAQRERRPNHVNLTLEAMCLGKMGETAAADARFAEAEAAYRDDVALHRRLDVIRARLDVGASR